MKQEAPTISGSEVTTGATVRVSFQLDSQRRSNVCSSPAQLPEKLAAGAKLALGKSLKTGIAKRLPLNNATGDSSTRVACGVSFIVVRFCVNHNRRATFVKEGVRSVPEGSVRIQKRRLGVSAGFYLDVQQVTGVRAFGIVFSMSATRRGEMTPGTDKIRR